jgi:tRNA uridine 5-carbamoylmethylation protein Kti12
MVKHKRVRKSKKTINHDLIWIQAYAVAKQESYIPVDDVSISKELVSDSNPERTLLEKERSEQIKALRQNLSEEARQVVEMIINAPMEIMKAIGVKTLKGVTAEKLEKYLRKQWRDRRYAHQVIQELSNFVKAF